MGADRSDEGFVPGGPGIAVGGVEPKGAGQDNGAVQAELRRDNALGVGRFIDAAAAGGVN